MAITRKKASRKKATKKTATRKPTTKKTANRLKGSPAGKRPVGKTSGLGIQQTWAKIFADNAKAGKANRLTDAQITEAMKREFPGRDSKVFGMVSTVRSKYNGGGLTGNVVPATLSVGYDESGSPIPPRGGGVAKSKPAAAKKKTRKSKKPAAK